MRYHSLVPLLNAAVNLLICAIVWRQGGKSRVSRSFAWMTITIVGWNLDIFALYYFADEASAEWWSRIFRTGVCLAPAAVFHFALTLAGSWGPVWRGLLTTAYAVSGILVVANLDGSLVDGLEPHTWGWYIHPTPLYSLLSATLVITLLLTLQRMWHAYRHPASARQRVQAKFWFLAALVQVPLTLTNLLPVYGVELYPLGNFGNVLYVWIVAYAIVRHRLMDVDYVVRKAVSFAIASAIVLTPGGFALLAMARALGSEAPVVLVCTAMMITLLAVILIPTLQQALETRVQRAFFPELYDYRRRLRELAAQLVHTLDQAELRRTLGDALIEILDVEECQIFLRDEETTQLRLVYPAGAPPEILPEAVVSVFERVPEPVLASEIEVLSPQAVPVFKSNNWEVGVPLHINRRLTGFIALSQNRDFRIFSGEDLQLLGAVAAGASVAIENASLSRQLRNSEIVLERANRLSSLGMLAAGIAHEIRNPLVAVKTFLDLLPQRHNDAEFMTSFRDLSLVELRRVTDLIADLLTLGKSKMAERRAVALGPTIEPVARLMETTARKRGITLTVRVEPNMPAVWGDADQLKQVVLNLLLNAIEISPPGSRVTLDARRQRHGEGVLIEVRDQGPGIPPDHMKSIFHPFFTTKESGTGLGLALVHQMIVEHGGEITVESEVGGGSVFRVTLPIEALTLARTGAGESGPAEPDPHPTPLTSRAASFS